MAEPTSPATAERPASALVYRPLSGLAIAGLVCGVAYAVLVLGSVVLSFLKREPFFLPTPLLALALGGFVLSVLALRQIRNSEGTRAGTGLARWGLWVSLVSGLGAGTFATFSGLAVEMQANSFLMDEDKGFFPLLQQGKVNAAFLLVVPPGRRDQGKPGDDKAMEDIFDIPFDSKSPKGLLATFREADFVRVLHEPKGFKVEVTPMGVKSWSYENGGYKVVRNYRLTTPEGEFDLPVTVQSSDPEEPGEPRRWRVLFGPDMRLIPVPDESNPRQPKLTPLGQRMTRLRATMVEFANSWLGATFSGDVSAACLGARSVEERRGLEGCQRTQIVGLPAVSVPGAINLALPVACAEAPYLFPAVLGEPGYKPPIVLKPGELRAPGRDDKFKNAVLRALSPEKVSLWPLEDLPTMQKEQKALEALCAHWEVSDNGKGKRLEFSLNVGFKVRFSRTQGAYVMGKLVLSVDKDADALQGHAFPDWQVERLEIERAVPGGEPVPKKR
jgi:hypothetical protein